MKTQSLTQAGSSSHAGKVSWNEAWNPFLQFSKALPLVLHCEVQIRTLTYHTGLLSRSNTISNAKESAKCSGLYEGEAIIPREKHSCVISILEQHTDGDLDTADTFSSKENL